MRKLLWLALSILTAHSICGCVTVPNVRSVSVAGTMSAGAVWAESETSLTGDLTLSELIDMIEPQFERECVPVPGFNICAEDQSHGEKVQLPARAGAIIQSAEDVNKLNTCLEQACRELGTHCSPEMKEAIRVYGGMLELHQRRISPHQKL